MVKLLDKFKESILNNKKTLVAALCVIILALASFIFFRSNTAQEVDSQSSSSQQTTSELQSENNDQASVKLTKAEVSKHSSADSCWTIIDAVVYDITEYVSRHPGGNEILRACGTDGTSLFNQRLTTSGESVGSGTPHSSSAQKQLEQFKLGNLQQ